MTTRIPSFLKGLSLAFALLFVSTASSAPRQDAPPPVNIDDLMKANQERLQEMMERNEERMREGRRGSRRGLCTFAHCRIQNDKLTGYSTSGRCVFCMRTRHSRCLCDAAARNVSEFPSSHGQ